MITSELYKTVLIDPPAEGGELFIVSGYASATFARRHLTETPGGPKVNLIIGMPSSAKNDHAAYLQLHKEFPDRFRGYYLSRQVPVHCKAYAWFENGEPKVGYSGSANYSQFGFFSDKQLNQMTVDDPAEIKALFDELLPMSEYMPDVAIEPRAILRLPAVIGSVIPGQIEWIEQDKSVRISFLDKKGNLPEISGLNWGQREGREKNQAYLSIKGDARKEGFLPERGFTFTLVTDDGATMDCVVAQEGRKAVHTTKNNSELGLYIRRRLGLEPGAFVTVDDLERYGRTDFTLVKIDDENFQLDFSVAPEAGKSDG